MREMLPQPEFFTIWTDFQTAGRGQAGNSWESEEGKNLTFSVLLHTDDIPPERQFVLSMVVPLAMVRVLNRLCPAAEPYTIKWPNDIYVGDRKLAGILIENILGENRYAIVGVGLNVNQTRFVSPAPNPTSLALETGREWDRETLLEAMVEELKGLRMTVLDEQLKQAYMASLYRREGYHPYVEREVNTIPTMNQQGYCEGAFEAHIADVLADGSLVLQLRSGEKKKYHFKQIRYIV